MFIRTRIRQPLSIERNHSKLEYDFPVYLYQKTCEVERGTPVYKRLTDSEKDKAGWAINTAYLIFM